MDTDLPGPERSGHSWAHDLVETSPEQLRAYRRKRFAVLAGVAVVICAIVGGIVYSVTDHRPPVVVHGNFKDHDLDLQSYVMPRPAGAEQPDPEPVESDPPGTPLALQEPVDHERLPAGDKRLNERSAAEAAGDVQYLRRFKFVRGYERHWYQPDGKPVAVRLLKFANAKNAANYVRDILDLYEINDAFEDTEVAGIPGGRSLRNTAPITGEDGLWSSISATAAGDVAVFVVAHDEQQFPNPKITETFLAQQYTRM